VVNSVLAGVIAGLVALQLVPLMSSAIVVGIGVALVAIWLFIAYAKRDAAAYLARMIRFQERRK
jgi:hypothetical protein